MRANTLVILPTYNERGNIEGIIKNILAYGANVLVIDDNSPDGTSAIVSRLAESDKRIELISRPKKLGLGSAYIAGFNRALQGKFDYIFTMDADFSHPHEKIPEFTALNADFVVGSRYIDSGTITGWPLHRLLLSKYANLYARILLGMPVKDVTSGFNCIRASILPGIGFSEIKSEGYGFLIELKHRVWKKGYIIIEKPIVFAERKVGSSKLGKKIIFEAFIMILKRALKLS